MEKFGCFAVISDGFATPFDRRTTQCDDCKIRYPKPKEKSYVTYHKSEDDWRRGISTEREFESDADAISFWHTVTNNKFGPTKISREVRYKINTLPGDMG